jgi:hypothetical protein
MINYKVDGVYVSLEEEEEERKSLWREEIFHHREGLRHVSLLMRFLRSLKSLEKVLETLVEKLIFKGSSDDGEREFK